MFGKLLLTAGLLTLGATGAEAQVYYTTPGYGTYPAPVYAAPPPPVVYNTAPQVVYAQPTYVQPAPVYYAQPAYYPGYYGYPDISLGFGFFGGHRWR